MNDFLGKPTEKVRKFVEEFKQLCINHKVKIQVSDYETLEIHNLCDDDVFGAFIEDKTEENV